MGWLIIEDSKSKNTEIIINADKIQTVHPESLTIVLDNNIHYKITQGAMDDFVKQIKQGIKED